jgi:hypothetical protein
MKRLGYVIWRKSQIGTRNAPKAAKPRSRTLSGLALQNGFKKTWRAFLPMKDQLTLQPPLLLQLFLPLQPMSPVLQPPLPLQLFRPLQSCLSVAALEEDAPGWSLEFEQPVETMAPASNPAMAAEMTNVLAVLDIIFSFQFSRLIHE